MKFDNRNYLSQKLTKITKPIFYLLIFFSVFSCKKDTKEAQRKEITTSQSPTINKASAFSELLSISGINDSLKKAFDESYCKYSEQLDGNKLWVVALKKGSLSFTKAKAFISLKKKELFVLVLSYEYDRRSYKQGDFGTYTGTISFYDRNIIKIKDLIYEKGNLKQIIPANCPTCVLCGNCPPPAAVDWCVSYPMLCGSNNGSNDPGEWQNMQPGDGGGGGTGTTYTATVTYLINTLSLPEAQANWLANNPTRADEMYNYLNNSSSSVTFDEKKQIAYDHLFNMMADASYLSFVVNHSQTSTSVVVWWEDDTWLSPYGGIGFGTWAINYLRQNPPTSFSVFQNQFMTIPEGQDGTSDATFWDDPNNTYQQQNLPSWSAFEAAFPKRSDPNYDTPAKLYASIGGAVLAQVGVNSNANTCAARVSKALNYSGITIPNISGKTFQGSDGKYYFLGAENLNRWMRKTFGCANPNTTIGEYLNSNSLHYNPNQIGTNGENLPSLLSGIRGIYSMVSNNYTWATGHADLMNLGPQCDGGCHFDGPVRYIDVWKLQ